MGKTCGVAFWSKKEGVRSPNCALASVALSVNAVATALQSNPFNELLGARFLRCAACEVERIVDSFLIASR
jgi:hypothetical protein